MCIMMVQASPVPNAWLCKPVIVDKLGHPTGDGAPRNQPESKVQIVLSMLLLGLQVYVCEVKGY